MVNSIDLWTWYIVFKSIVEYTQDCRRSIFFYLHAMGNLEGAKLATYWLIYRNNTDLGFNESYWLPLRVFICIFVCVSWCMWMCVCARERICVCVCLCAHACARTYRYYIYLVAVTQLFSKILESIIRLFT